MPPSELPRWLRLNAGGDHLILRRLRQQVAGQLLDGEPVEGHVAVEGIDHPIAPAPHVALAIALVAIAVGVARGFEPRVGHALAVARRGQQPIHDLFIGVSAILSAMKASISAAVGGRPVRSRLTRRSQVARSASVEGDSPSCSSCASTKASMGLLHPGLLRHRRQRPGASASRRTSAPATWRPARSTCAAARSRAWSAGPPSRGIRTSGSSSRSPARSGRSATGSPGTMAMAAGVQLRLRGLFLSPAAGRPPACPGHGTCSTCPKGWAGCRG